MHDCRQTQESLIDVIFDETDAAARARLFAEVERCAACAAEYRSYAATLDACDEAAVALAPEESYWPRYHAALARRLHGAASESQGARAPSRRDARLLPRRDARVLLLLLSRTPFWKRLLTTSIRVPAPLAAVAALLLVVASFYSLALVARPAPEPVVIAAPDIRPATAAPQIKFVEVPVVREKIVTQIIYVPRRDDTPRRSAPRENLAGVGRPGATATVAGTPTPRRNLSGFKPAGEVNLRIIKGEDAREQ